ncbi:hypothetical protein ACFQ20_25635, partial [Pseudoroseomonas ludipueritiae]
MAGEDDLRERLRKIEAVIVGAGMTGEREAAGAALERVKVELERALRAHLQGATAPIIHDAVHANTSDAEEVNPDLPSIGFLEAVMDLCASKGQVASHDGPQAIPVRC